ncbi:hypothetical protein [Burkholderia pseudomultivorans]|uniref:hypothetical protein n=1 Tax=Burkholderia pseudomultivorans TaxID=1207504 RepID=UPI0012D9CBDF|nr:hypothetical protein [Burkholderia pseudomultivorans]
MPASDVPIAFSAVPADSDSPLDIGRPEYAEHADDDTTVCAGRALHAMLSSGMDTEANTGAASISASVEIDMRTVFFIGGPSV